MLPPERTIGLLTMRRGNDSYTHWKNGWQEDNIKTHSKTKKTNIHSESRNSTTARPEHLSADESEENDLKNLHENDRGPPRGHKKIP